MPPRRWMRPCGAAGTLSAQTAYGGSGKPAAAQGAAQGRCAPLPARPPTSLSLRGRERSPWVAFRSAPLTPGAPRERLHSMAATVRHHSAVVARRALSLRAANCSTVLNRRPCAHVAGTADGNNRASSGKLDEPDHGRCMMVPATQDVYLPVQIVVPPISACKSSCPGTSRGPGDPEPRSSRSPDGPTPCAPRHSALPHGLPQHGRNSA